MTPADELRAAAEKLRALATAASTDTDGTPTAHWHSKDQAHDHSFLYGDYLTRDDGRTISWPLLLRGGSAQRPSHMHPQHAAYAAAMGPTVGLALADWLDVASVNAVVLTWPNDFIERALTVARAINGDQQ
ncbi:hypothetical protein [Streptomyces sp. NPDC057413]|uniref:hypothetical protein n=1 Tax=Streptomyces sp. NPDC057413 TaxID=3346124 RepID=UPI0036C7785D